MEIKVNIPLIDKISSLFAKSAPPPKRREETTETSTETIFESFYYKKVKLERTRRAKYGDYVVMDEEYPEISTALDLYADNATKEKTEGSSIEVKSRNTRVQNLLDDLMKRTKVQETLWDTARSIAKMGDDFDEVVVDGDAWIDRLKHLEPETMFREQDEYGRDKEKPYVQKDETGVTKLAEFERWQIIHWKNGGQKRLYGESVLKSIRRVYKQLQMMEDGMVIGRLTRSHLRYKFLIDVEGMSVEEREEYIKKVKNEMRKKRLINPLTGQLEEAQNPLCLTGDTKIPLLDGRELTILELMNEFREEEKFWVYASDGMNTVPALATRPWKSGVSTEIVEVKLDDGNSVRCTPSHGFMMRDGTWKKASDLVPGDSLMPLYRQTDERGYEHVYPANDGRSFLHTHKVVAMHSFPEIWRHTKLRTTHHKNFDRHDNRPENLEIISWWDHRKLHVGLLETTIHRPEPKEKSRVSRRRPEYLMLRLELTKKQMDEVNRDPVKSEKMKEVCRKLLISLNYNRDSKDRLNRIREYNQANKEEKSRILTGYNKSKKHREVARKTCAGTGKKIWQNKEYRKRKSGQMSKMMKEKWRDLNYREQVILSRKPDFFTEFLGLNHKVVSVQPCGREDVYDLSVEKYHCFAVSAGVIVHNSAEEDFFVGVTKESKANVDVLQGATNLGNIRDVEYFQTKLFAGLKVPKAFVGLEKDVKAKATIVEEDIQFARTVGRIRKGLRIGLKQLFNYQLILQGIAPAEGLYVISFEPISMVDEMRKWTMEKLKAEVAKLYRIDMSLLSDRFILKKFLGMSDEEIEAVLREKPVPNTLLSPKKATTPSLRAAGATGVTTPAVGGLNPMAMVSQMDDRVDNFHIVMLHMMNLVETLRDLVELELNR
jgi:hypothetical protein